MQGFNKGVKVNFTYRNAVNEVVHAYGTIADYKKRFYYVKVADDMPLIKVYCNKVTLSEKDTTDFTIPQKDSKTEFIKRNEIIPIPNYYDQLESVLFHIKVILGLNAFTCLLLLLAIFR